MSRFLFTMLPANDLGLPTRLVPIARALADRGHEVAMFNPAPAPTALIVGTPETDPVSPSAPVTHIGPVVWQRGNAELPEWLVALGTGKPLV